MAERRVSTKEAKETITGGESAPAKHRRTSFRKNFQYNKKWSRKFYHIKQVMPIIKKESNKIIVVTVYAFYF